jgi:PAS domain S-box-containing protein
MLVCFWRMSQGVEPSARLAAIVASSEDAIISKDLNGVITSWNDAAERMFGYTADEAVGHHIRLIIPADRRSEEDYVIGQVRAGNKLDHYQTIRCRKDGTPVQVSLSVSPIRDASGTVVGASKIVRDITTSQQLQHEALRLAAIVSSSDDAIISKDLNGIVQTWNPSAERIFGYTAEEAIGNPITIIIPEERLPEEVEVLSRIRAGLSVEHFETVRRRKDGTLIDISLTVSPVRMPDGQIVGASKIARDITYQRRLRDAADYASRMKDEFLAVLSHELRTPLNTVLGYAKVLKRDDARMTADIRSRALRALERNAEVLTRLVNDVLDTSRIVSGKLRLALDNCAVEQFVAEAIETIRPAAEAKEIELSVAVTPGLVVYGDRDRLQQVVWNLLSNAIKFTPQGGTVSIRAERHDNMVEIAVADSGIGIPPEQQPYIFQRFWQGDTTVSREHGGLGIGLALARHLVEMHGGSIAVESAGHGRGALFTVRLPDVNSASRERSALGPHRLRR